MADPEWLIKARKDLSTAARTGHRAHENTPCRACEETVAALALVFVRETEAAYQRGLMAGRSQAGYTTRRKRKEEPCTQTDAPCAETRSRASSTGGDP